MTHFDAIHGSTVISYLTLRKAIGVIGVSLPFVLVIGKWLLQGPGIESSVSAYYHTVMGDVFVGSLFSMAVFMLSYRGFGPVDDVAGDLAFAFAIGAAIFPIAPDAVPTDIEELVSIVHVTFAGLFFLTLTYFSLVLFRKTDPTRPMTPQKVKRNRVYAISGYTMLVCLALIAAVAFVSDDAAIHEYDPVFWLESIVILAFGVAWLTKGEAILKDRHT